MLSQLRDIWNHRQLLYFLTLRDIKVRYKQAFFGIAWAIITPLSQAVVFAIIFGVLLKVSSNNVPYILLAFTGMAFWNFFSQSITMSTFALTGNFNLVTKSAFPKEILVLATIFSRVPDLVFSFLVLIVMMLYYHINPQIISLWVVPVFAIEVILTIGVGLFFAATNVYYRDVTAVTPLLLMIWLYITPIIYPLQFIPEQYRVYISLNPLTGIIDGIRSILLFQELPEFSVLSLSLFSTVVIFLVSYNLFKRLEKGFADTI